MTSVMKTVFALTAMGSLIAACSDNGGETSGGGGNGGSGVSSSSSVSASASTSASSTSASSSSSSGGPVVPELKFVLPFDAAKGELPEGLILTPDGTAALVSLAPTGEIVKVSLADGKRSTFGKVPTPPAMGGFVLGLAFDKAGELYVGVASFDATKYQAGVYKIPKTGGDGVLFSKDPAITFANGLVFDKDDNLFVSDSPSGKIYKIAKDGVAKVWASDPVLVGGKGSGCDAQQPFSIGTNGLAIVGTDLFTVNTDKASLVKIPINADGTAGTATEVVKTDCTNLAGADGLYADVDGSLIVADNFTNQLVRIGTDGKSSVIVKGGEFDFPTSAVPGTVNGQRNVYIVNAAFAPGADGKAHPGLLSYGPLAPLP